MKCLISPLKYGEDTAMVGYHHILEILLARKRVQFKVTLLLNDVAVESESIFDGDKIS